MRALNLRADKLRDDLIEQVRREIMGQLPDVRNDFLALYFLPFEIKRGRLPRWPGSAASVNELSESEKAEYSERLAAAVEANNKSVNPEETRQINWGIVELWREFAADQKALMASDRKVG